MWSQNLFYLLTFNFDNKCQYLQENQVQHSEEKQYILDLITYCRKIRPFV